MNSKDIEIIAEAIKDLAGSVRELADSVAADEPLNYSVSRGLRVIAEAIADHQSK